jgi:hypothetical protein
MLLSAITPSVEKWTLRPPVVVAMTEPKVCVPMVCVASTLVPAVSTGAKASQPAP